MIAAFYDHPSLVSELLRRGANPTLKDLRGKAALDWATSPAVRSLLLNSTSSSSEEKTEEKEGRGSLPATPLSSTSSPSPSLLSHSTDRLLTASLLRTPPLHNPAASSSSTSFSPGFSPSLDISIRPSIFDSAKLQRILCELDDDIDRKKRELHLLLNSSGASASALKAMRSDLKKPLVSPTCLLPISFTSLILPLPFYLFLPL